jgi:hypothetical protein
LSEVRKMPAPYSVGARLRIIGELHGQTTVNVMHFGSHDIVDDPNQLNALLLQLAEAMAECITTVLLPAVTADWRYVRVEAQSIHPNLSDPVVATGVPENVGTLSAASASFLSSLVHVHTGIDGRKGRGRIFLPPPGEAETQNSLVDGPTLVLLAAFLACVATKFMGADPDTSWHFGVLSTKDLKAVGGSFNTAFREAISLNPKAEISLMSSRKVGRGV